jgi:hypothetical protein
VPSIPRKVSREVEVEGPAGSADCVSTMRLPAFILGCLASLGTCRLVHFATTATGFVISLQCRGTERKVPFKYVTASHVYPTRTDSEQTDLYRSVMSSSPGAGGGWLCPACTLLCNIGRGALQTGTVQYVCVSGTCKPTIPTSSVRHPGWAPMYNSSYICIAAAVATTSSSLPQRALASLSPRDSIRRPELYLPRPCWSN